MKNFTRIIALVFMLFFANGVFAAAEKTFNVYIMNHTPFNIYPGISNWNKTPLHIVESKVPPASLSQRVAVGVTVNNSATIAFYAHVTEEPKNYFNTLVITYSFGNTNNLQMDPDFLRIHNKIYKAKVVNYDSVSNDIVLELG